MTRHLATTPLVRARSTPDSLEAATDYACVMDGMSRVAVAKVILDRKRPRADLPWRAWAVITEL